MWLPEILNLHTWLTFVHRSLFRQDGGALKPPWSPPIHLHPCCALFTSGDDNPSLQDPEDTLSWFPCLSRTQSPFPPLCF